jgi:dihydroorotate dehydrogenase (NAD+) catalytic subunit
MKPADPPTNPDPGLVAGASAVQLGAVNFFDPTASLCELDGLPRALEELGAASVREVVGTLR